MQISGAFTRPVKGVDKFILTASAVPNLKLESPTEGAVGVWTKAKPVLEGFLFVSESDIADLLILVAGKRLVGCSFTFEPLRYGHAHILSAQLSTTAIAE